MTGTNELKTLEDLEPLYYDKEEERFYVKIEQIKAEAMKWVKFKNWEIENKEKGIIGHLKEFQLRGEISFIAHFFNLTSEDLKDE